MRVLAAFAALILLATAPVFAQESVRAKVLPESSIQIHGTSTVNSFVCASTAIDGWAQLEGSGRRADSSVNVVVPVRSFDCGKRKMNADMQAAMKAGSHPAIQFELSEAVLVDGPASGNGDHRLLVDGRLRLAGSERAVSFFVSGRETTDGKMYVTGHAPLRMSDFGIDPPSALLGLVQANDRIEVHFNLVAVVEHPMETARR
jgi:polyisoprenoid-binding protein YceI